MLFEVPRLFDRAFIIGFLTPSLAFVVASNYLYEALELKRLVYVHASVKTPAYVGKGFFTVILALVLLAFNLQIIRLIIGQSQNRLLNLLKRRKIRRFDHLSMLASSIEPLERHIKLNEELANTFPDERARILPHKNR